MPAATGAHSELWYRWELDASDNPDFGVGSATTDGTDKPFGGDASTPSLEITNNPLDVFEPNDREMAQLVAQHFEGSVTVEFEITNPWWLQGVIAQATTVDNLDGSWTHTFDGDVPLPMVVYVGYDGVATDTGNDQYRYLKGVVNQTATITTTVEGAAECSYSAIFADDQWEETPLTGQPTLDEDVMTFAQASLSLSASTLSLVQDASVEINNNTDIIRELGTRLGVDYSPKGRIPSVTATKIREDSDEISEMYGSAAAQTVQETVEGEDPMVYQLDNGEAAGAGINQMQLDMGGGFPESLTSENLGNPQEDLQQGINRRLRTISAEATNETSTAP